MAVDENLGICLVCKGSKVYLWATLESERTFAGSLEGEDGGEWLEARGLVSLVIGDLHSTKCLSFNYKHLRINQVYLSC